MNSQFHTPGILNTVFVYLLFRLYLIYKVYEIYVLNYSYMYSTLSHSTRTWCAVHDILMIICLQGQRVIQTHLKLYSCWFPLSKWNNKSCTPYDTLEQREEVTEPPVRPLGTRDAAGIKNANGWAQSVGLKSINNYAAQVKLLKERLDAARPIMQMWHAHWSSYCIAVYW